VFDDLRGDLAICPIYHQTDERIEAQILAAFLAYCLQVTLKQRLRSLAPGLTQRLDKMAAIQMVDVQLPTTDGRTVILSRYTELERDQALLRFSGSRSTCPTNRVAQDHNRQHNDCPFCGADLATRYPGKPTVSEIFLTASCRSPDRLGDMPIAFTMPADPPRDRFVTYESTA
jgi:hypothetical protein